MTRSSRSAPTRREPASHYQTREFVSDTLDAVNRARVYQFAPTLPDEYERTTVVLVKNTGADADRYRPLAIQGCLPPTAAESIDWYIDNVLLEARPPISGDRNNFVVPVVPISSGETGLCAVAGLVSCPVYFSGSNATWIRRCDMEAGFGTLVATPEGAATIVYADPTALAGALPGNVDCIVQLAPPVNVAYPGVASGTIPAGGTGTVSLYQDDADTTYTIAPVHLDHMEQGLDVSSGKEVLVEWFHMEKRWRVIGAECEDSDPPMVFRGDWDAANAPFAAGSTVNHYSFLMHAKVATSQDPTPSISGSPSFSIPDSPSWSSATDPGWLYTGNRFKVGAGTVLQGYRVWLPNVGGTFEYTSLFRNVTDPANPQTISSVNISSFPGITAGWFEEGTERFVVYDDEEWEIGLIAENTAASTDHLNEPWRYAGTSQNAEPFNGGFNTNNQNNILRIDIDDDNGVDQSTALSGIVPGDVIQIYDSGNRRHYAVISNDGLGISAYWYTVQQLLEIGALSLGAIYTVQVERTGSLTDYVSLPSYWDSNTPAWASTVQGVFVDSAGGSPVSSNDAFGADLLQADWQVPSDWDVVAISARTF